MAKKSLRQPALDPMQVKPRSGSSYPRAFRAPVRERSKRRLGEAAGLTRFGVNLVTLAPGSWSSQRHWHSHEDEFVYILQGRATLVTDSGEQVLGPGMAAGFPGGQADGHHLINKTNRPVVYLEIGNRDPDDECQYPDVDLYAKPEAMGGGYTDKKGKRY